VECFDQLDMRVGRSPHVTLSRFASPANEASTTVTEGFDTSSIRVRVLDSWSAAEWDRLTHPLPGRGPIHSGGWAETLIASYRFQPLYLVAETGGVVCGALPLMEVDSLWTGRRGVSLPFSDACDVLAASEEVGNALLRAAVDISRERGWKYLESRPVRPPDVESRVSRAYVQHVLSLDRSESEIWDGCDATARRGVRKAKRSGVIASIEDGADAMSEYYRLHLLTRRRHGLPPQPLKFFRNLQERVLDQNGGFVVLARSGGRAIAGAVFLCAGNHALFKFGASDHKFQAFRGNNLVMWEGITRSKARGCSVFSFGRTDPDQVGLRKFKLQWGALERKLEYFYLGENETSTHLRRRGAPRWARGALRCCPAVVARVAGELLYRHNA
jgi:CelD/BcsL family acetyltransferase involved in cellulose biosynthesis